MVEFLNTLVPLWVLFACLVIIIFGVVVRFGAMQDEIDRVIRSMMYEEKYPRDEIARLRERVTALEARQLKNRLIRWLKGCK